MTKANWYEMEKLRELLKDVPNGSEWFKVIKDLNKDKENAIRRDVYNKLVHSDSFENSEDIRYMNFDKSPEQILLEKERDDLLYKAISKLDPIDQLIIINRFKNESTLEEVKLIVNLSVPTISRHQNKALHKLKKLLSDLW